MTTEPARKLGGHAGEILIRPSDSWADRAAPVLFACALLAWAGALWRDIDGMPSGRIAESASGLCLMSVLWLIVFALACARIAWMFLGATKLSVSSKELVVQHCIAGEAISTSAPIALSAIRDVRVKEQETRFKGNVWHRWTLVVLLNDGTERQIANFRSGGAANEFLSAYVR